MCYVNLQFHAFYSHSVNFAEIADELILIINLN